MPAWVQWSNLTFSLLPVIQWTTNECETVFGKVFLEINSCSSQSSDLWQAKPSKYESVRNWVLYRMLYKSFISPTWFIFLHVTVSKNTFSAKLLKSTIHGFISTTSSLKKHSLGSWSWGQRKFKKWKSMVCIYETVSSLIYIFLAK